MTELPAKRAKPGLPAAPPTRTFRTLVVATALCQRALCDATLDELQSVTGWLYGEGGLFSWEMAYPPMIGAARAEGYRQFPLMPTKEEADRSWSDAAELALNGYGATVEVLRGPHERTMTGMQTLRALGGRGARVDMPLRIRSGQPFA